jgi:hypothetical protein
VQSIGPYYPSDIGMVIHDKQAPRSVCDPLDLPGTFYDQSLA